MTQFYILKSKIEELLERTPDATLRQEIIKLEAFTDAIYERLKLLETTISLLNEYREKKINAL